MNQRLNASGGRTRSYDFIKQHSSSSITVRFASSVTGGDETWTLDSIDVQAITVKINNTNASPSYYRSGGTRPFPRQFWGRTPFAIGRRQHIARGNQIRADALMFYTEAASQPGWQGWGRFQALTEGFVNPSFRWSISGNGSSLPSTLLNSEALLGRQFGGNTSGFPSLLSTQVTVTATDRIGSLTRTGSIAANWHHQYEGTNRVRIYKDRLKTFRLAQHHPPRGDYSIKYANAPNRNYYYQAFLDEILQGTSEMIEDSSVGGVGKIIARVGKITGVGATYASAEEQEPTQIASWDQEWNAALNNHSDSRASGPLKDTNGGIAGYFVPSSLKNDTSTTGRYNNCYAVLWRVNYRIHKKYHADKYDINGYVSSGHAAKTVEVDHSLLQMIFVAYRGPFYR